MKLSEYAKYDGLGLAKLVKNKEVTQEELRNAALKAMDIVNPKLNAVARTIPKSSETSSHTTEGTFAGVPFMLKDVPQMVANVPFNNGSRFLKGNTSDHDHNLTKRLRKSGLNPVGVTTVPEFSSLNTTESVLYGATHNPWNTDYSTGGSSGGSAAAVAGGIVPLAHGGDGGGSIRTPASINGLVGLKPTRGRIPNGPDRGEGIFGTAMQFGLTKTVRDTAALLDVANGPDTGCYAAVERPKVNFAEEIKTPPKNLKIAWMNTSFSGKKADKDHDDILLKTVKICEELGHEVVNEPLEIDTNSLGYAMYNFHISNVASGIKNAAKSLNRTPSEENIEPHIWHFYQEGLKMSALDLVKAVDIQNVISRRVGQYFKEYDVLLLPTMLHSADKLGGKYYEMPEGNVSEVMAHSTTSLFNLTGLPAISLPLGWSPSGLPIGMQFAGGFGDEATLLKLSRQLEIAQPWENKKTPLIDKLDTELFV